MNDGVSRGGRDEAVSVTKQKTANKLAVKNGGFMQEVTKNKTTKTETQKTQKNLISKKVSLAGKFFHSFVIDSETGKRTVQWQGYIYGPVTDCGLDGYYYARLFSWIDGMPTDKIILHISNMTYDSFVFYDSDEEMNEVYYRKYSSNF